MISSLILPDRISAIRHEAEGVRVERAYAGAHAQPMHSMQVAAIIKRRGSGRGLLSLLIVYSPWIRQCFVPLSLTAMRIESEPCKWSRIDPAHFINWNNEIIQMSSFLRDVGRFLRADNSPSAKRAHFEVVMTAGDPPVACSSRRYFLPFNIPTTATVLEVFQGEPYFKARGAPFS